MNPEIKSQWVVALRSDEFKKGVGFLSAGGAYCCLGVLCELALRAEIVEKIVPSITIPPANRYGPTKEIAYLPEEVRTWAGLLSSDPVVNYKNLSSINDSSAYTFSEIADMIERSDI